MQEKIKTVVLCLVFSLPVGVLIAGVFVTAWHDGITPNLFKNFDVLAFWYETPFYRGHVTPVFQNSLTIIGAVSALTTIAAIALVARRQNHHGDAHWARYSEMVHAGYIRPYRKITGPIFGKSTGPRWPGNYLTNGDQPHSLIVAPTRAGKGVGIVIPTLLTFNGSILALDVKGELFEMTSRSRKARGDKVYKFAPFDPNGHTNSYNPVLDIVNMPPDRRFSETRRLAANLIEAKGKGSEGFIDGARDLFVAGILACIERGTPTIGAVYDLFSQPGEKYKLFAQLAEDTKDVEAQRIFDNMAGNDTKILTSYTSVLGDGGLNLWADPLIKAATTTSDFSIYDLRRDPTSVFLCVSPNDLEVISPLVRLFFQQIVSILQRTMPGKDESFEVLFLLDEFKHLGRLEAIETAVTTIAGYKGRFMFIIQSLSALTGAYEASGKENFLSNTGIQVFMATADDETPDYISKAIGDYTYRSRSKSYNQSQFFDANIQISDQGAPLLRPEQVRLLDDDTQIVLIKGRPPLKMKKVKYYADRMLSRLFEQQVGPLPEPKPLILTKAEVPDEFEPEPVAPIDDGVPMVQRERYILPEDQQEFDEDESDGGAEVVNGMEPGAENQSTSDVQAALDEPELTSEEIQALVQQRQLLERIVALQMRSDREGIDVGIQ